MKIIFGILAIGLMLTAALLVPHAQQQPTPTAAPPTPTYINTPPIVELPFVEARPEIAAHITLPGKLAFIMETDLKQYS